MSTEVPNPVVQENRTLSEWSNQMIPRCSQSHRACLPDNAFSKRDRQRRERSFAGPRKGNPSRTTPVSTCDTTLPRGLVQTVSSVPSCLICQRAPRTLEIDILANGERQRLHIYCLPKLMPMRILFAVPTSLQLSLGVFRMPLFKESNTYIDPELAAVRLC